ncbi:MAG: glycosyltransferase [Chitinispirillaceae bacterium]|nr:glycosyltransferase [Chitinispirillaceae bacterium]
MKKGDMIAAQQPRQGDDVLDKQSQFTREKQAYWNTCAVGKKRWELARRDYRKRLAEVYRFLIPPGSRVLELGCGQGDLLAGLQPSRGVGIDFASAMVERARARHPELTIVHADIHDRVLDEQFDAVICSDVVNDVWDVQQVFKNAAAHAHSGTRLILNLYSRLWEAPRWAAEFFGIARPLHRQNWLTVEDVTNLLYLVDFEVIRTFEEILWPFRIPLVDAVMNRYLVKVWPFNVFGLTNFIVARPSPKPDRSADPVVSVIVPARNEEGNIKTIFDRVPEIGAGTELVFVEGHSTDNTRSAIEHEIASRPERSAKLLFQIGKGKGDAVRLGFANATGDLLMILDADLTVPPEDLTRFYEAWRSGKGELINGVRLVYPMEKGAMRFFNLVGNKFFTLIFSWILGQSIKDTLCGTKVLSRRHYDLIAANRSYFGSLDPFGDFDLIFGAARYNLKIVDLPIRYRERTYGRTNIHRWRHGVLLFRMVILALRRLKFV